MSRARGNYQKTKDLQQPRIVQDEIPCPAGVFTNSLMVEAATIAFSDLPFTERINKVSEIVRIKQYE